MIIDKDCIQQIFGCLLKHPQYLSEIDKYSLSNSDFHNRFEKYLFEAIAGLYDNGAKRISAFDVENYFKTDQTAMKIFEQNNGIEYLQDIEEYSNEENFPYYYNKLKKFNLLNELKKEGIDIDDFYIEDLTKPKSLEINENFEKLSIQDITNAIKKKLLKLERDYIKVDEVQSWKASDEIAGVIETFGSHEDIGLPIQGDIYSKVINGAEVGALTIRSAPSGSYKTRSAVADACYLAYPIRYNSLTCCWEQSGNCQKVLFVITEQNISQILKMLVAYLSDINESKFRYGCFTNDEVIRIKQAENIIKYYSDNFHILRVPNPNVSLIQTLIRESCVAYGIEYVFYDYIFVSPALLSEFKGSNLRNDECLLLMANTLKNLAVELNVCVFTSTQVNANADDNKNIRNEASLAGGRSTINKADNGSIMARPTKEDLDLVQQLSTKIPNLVTDVFKVRSGMWSQVRIWSYFDGGTMRREDLFITDSKYNLIESFFDEPNIQTSNWEENDVNSYLEILNKGGTKEIHD